MKWAVTQRLLACVLSTVVAVPAAAAELWELQGEISPEVRAMVAAPKPHFATTSRPDAVAKLSLYPHTQVDGLVRTELDWRYGLTATSVVEVRADEVWVRWAKGAGALTVGRQVFRWGTIDEFGVVDVLNPQRLLDLGADAAQRKLGVWAASSDISVGPVRLQAVVMPWFTPSEFGAASPFVTTGLPRPQARAVAEMAAAAQAAAAGATTPDTGTGNGGASAGVPASAAGSAGAELSPVLLRPQASLRNVQAGLRAVFALPFADLALLGARLFDQIGTARVVSDATGLPQVRIIYPEVWMLGAEFTMPIGDWSLAVESAYFHTSDRDGTDPFVRNPTLHSAAEVRWKFHPDWEARLGIQDQQIFYDQDNVFEHADERSLPIPLGSPLMLLDPRLAHAVLTYTFGAEFSKLTAAYVWAYESHGHFASVELDYGIVAGLRLLLGGQMFAGRRGQGFGSIDHLDNVYAGLRLLF